jgi:hypothetical protein
MHIEADMQARVCACSLLVLSPCFEDFADLAPVTRDSGIYIIHGIAATSPQRRINRTGRMLHLPEAVSSSRPK